MTDVAHSGDVLDHAQLSLAETSLDPADDGEWAEMRALGHSMSSCSYRLGNVHPRFWGRVQGTGSDVGMFAELLGGAMNMNASGLASIASHAARPPSGVSGESRRRSPQLLAPAPLNVVCVRFRPVRAASIDLDAVNRELLMRLYEEGTAMPTRAVIRGCSGCAAPSAITAPGATISTCWSVG